MRQQIQLSLLHADKANLHDSTGASFEASVEAQHCNNSKEILNLMKKQTQQIAMQGQLLATQTELLATQAKQIQSQAKEL